MLNVFVFIKGIYNNTGKTKEEFSVVPFRIWGWLLKIGIILVLKIQLKGIDINGLKRLNKF